MALFIVNLDWTLGGKFYGLRKPVKWWIDALASSLNKNIFSVHFTKALKTAENSHISFDCVPKKVVGIRFTRYKNRCRPSILSVYELGSEAEVPISKAVYAAKWANKKGKNKANKNARPRLTSCFHKSPHFTNWLLLFIPYTTSTADLRVNGDVPLERSKEADFHRLLGMPRVNMYLSL